LPIRGGFPTAFDNTIILGCGVAAESFSLLKVDPAMGRNWPVDLSPGVWFIRSAGGEQLAGQKLRNKKWKATV
jgi:hypothetical protein